MMRMRATRRAAFGFLSCAALTIGINVGVSGEVDEDGPSSLDPPRYSFQRYETIWAERSPFALREEPVPPPPEDPKITKDYALVGYYTRDGIIRVTVINTKTKERLYLEKGKPALDGFQFVSLQRGNTYKDTVVNVVKNGHKGTIHFGAKELPSKKMGMIGKPTLRAAKPSPRTPKPKAKRRVILPRVSGRK